MSPICQQSKIIMQCRVSLLSAFNKPRNLVLKSAFQSVRLCNDEPWVRESYPVVTSSGAFIIWSDAQNVRNHTNITNTINEYLKFPDTKSYSNVLCHILVVVLAIQHIRSSVSTALQARHPSHSRRFWMQYSERKWPKPFGPCRGFSGAPRGLPVGSPTTGHEKHTGVFRGHEIGGIVWYSTTYSCMGRMKTLK